MIVGARRAGLSISKAADPLGFPSETPISGIYRDWSEKRKYPLCVNSLREKSAITVPPNEVTVDAQLVTGEGGKEKETKSTQAVT